MTAIRIVERFTLPDPGGDPAQSRWFADWAARRPHEVDRHLVASWRAIQSLEGLPFDHVHHWFGGIGAQALMTDWVTKCGNRTIYENDPLAVAYLRRVFDAEDVFLADSYRERCYPGRGVKRTLQVADFGDLTALRMTRDPWSPMLDKIFGHASTTHVLLTDIAGPRLHLQNFADAQMRVVGPFTSHAAYLSRLGEYVTHRWGFVPVETFYHRWSSVTVYQRPTWLMEPHVVTDVSGDPLVGYEVVA